MRKRRDLNSVYEFISAENRAIALARLDQYVQADPRDIDILEPTPTKSLSEALCTISGCDPNVAKSLTRIEIIDRLVTVCDISPKDLVSKSIPENIDLNLNGLNRVLEDLGTIVKKQNIQKMESLIRLRELTTFNDCKTKIEAIGRIADLTGFENRGIGLGSTEYKESLIDIAKYCGYDIDTKLSKPRYAEKLAELMGVPWTRQCWSTGSTITLEGLNRLIFGIVRKEAEFGGKGTRSPREEAQAFSRAIMPQIQPVWEGKRCVTRMLDEESRNWAQMEWIGFYFEHVAIPPLLENRLISGPINVASTAFDAYGTHVWDLKTHNTAREDAPLNDKLSMRAAVENYGGLGFCMLEGEADFDDKTSRDFQLWVERLKKEHGKRYNLGSIKPRSRLRKSAFYPEKLKFYFVKSIEHMEELEKAETLKPFHQGRNSGKGDPRNVKYRLYPSRADGLDFILSTEMII